VLQEGVWNLNPWFAQVEQVPLMEIPTGTVGVVISNVGEVPRGVDHDLVDRGFKGIWKTPLNAGTYPINTRAMDVVIVPTHDITLDWSDPQGKPRTNYDADLTELQLSSNDGFTFKVEVTQVIRIAPQNAPKMISRVVSEGVAASALRTELQDVSIRKFSSIRNLVTRVLQPMVGNYFRGAAQEHEALNFLKRRREIQVDAIERIQRPLDEYGVQAVNTLINEIHGLEELEDQLRAQTTYTEQQKTEEVYRKLLEKQEQTKYEQEQAIHERTHFFSKWLHRIEQVSGEIRS
jgi:hypothetical protein